MHHRSSDHVDWGPAPEEYFTGRAWFGPMAPADDDSDLHVIGVGFEPGARTFWHSHPGGQVLYCVSGLGVVGNEAGERATLTPGATVRVPPGELHWHGASADSPMLHLSITVAQTEWTDRPVSEDQYRGT